MATKLIGTSTVLTLSASTQTVTLVGNQVGNYNNLLGQALPVVNVRIAATQPAFIGFGVAITSSTGLLLPGNTTETFKMDGTSTVTVLQAGSGGIISITPVA